MACYTWVTELTEFVAALLVPVQRHGGANGEATRDHGRAAAKDPLQHRPPTCALRQFLGKFIEIPSVHAGIPSGASMAAPATGTDK